MRTILLLILAFGLPISGWAQDPELTAEEKEEIVRLMMATYPRLLGISHNFAGGDESVMSYEELSEDRKLRIVELYLLQMNQPSHNFGGASQPSIMEYPTNF